MKKTATISTLAIVACSLMLLTPGFIPAAGNPALQGLEIERVPYDEVRIREFPIAMQCWTFRKFTFFETLDKVKDLGIRYLEAYPGQRLSQDLPGVSFGHEMDDKTRSMVKERLQEAGITLISYGVVGFDNTEESMGQVFEFARAMRIHTINTEPKYDDFSLLEKMVRRHNIRVAIHNHPPPTKYARPLTVLERVQGLDPRIGACADTGHWLRTGVDPVEALRLLEGRITNVHLKDLDQFGIREARDVPFGQGKANVRKILAELTQQNYYGPLVVEHENPADIDNPSPPIRAGLDYIDSIAYYKGYEQILGQRNGRFHKQGWNHYGPGYFILNERTGTMKSQGGMGLLWYSARKYGDFVLDLEFKCEFKNTNSGVFLRVPEMPVNNDYIYHSFEIQIDDASEGIHHTGAAYDAEAPSALASKPPGEWNHFRITVQGERIQVDLNGTRVLDWEAEPRGKVRDFAREGYLGLQNHDSRSPVYFRNIFVKDLTK
ncbi:MAG: family 16 glycoside hydrolase [Candidatus Aminicenantaceae bacterium]